jgi:acetyltransferase-like isoleucine patch superfamily enzyme
LNVISRIYFYSPLNILIINTIFQKLFRINGDCKFQVHFTSTVICPSNLHLGNNTYSSLALSGNCYLQAGNGIWIGDDTIFAPGVKIISANHDPSNNMEWKKDLPVLIGKRCWIGANSVILPGVQLGDDCVVGAGSVVNKCFPDNTVIAGVPAKRIK